MTNRMFIFPVLIAISVLVSACDPFTTVPLCEAPGVLNYKDRVEQLLEDTSDAAERLGELLSRAGSDNSLLTNAVWRQSITEQVQNFVRFSQQANQMSPPRQEFNIFHELLKNAYSDYADGVALLEDAVLSNDLDMFTDAIAILSSGDEKRNAAIDEFNSVFNRC